MARRTGSKGKGAKTNGRSVPDSKFGGTPSFFRTGQGELSSVRSTNGWPEGQAKDHDHLQQLIAERAYFLYERSGFQDGYDVEHWLEAERQIKKVWDQAA